MMGGVCSIAGGRVLVPGGFVDGETVVVEDGHIAGLGGAARGSVWDARGLAVLPGIVDLHGDAFERQIMPRPGVQFALDLALAETDRQLVTNGITTAFHALTWSWEPGLRGRDMALAFAVALARLRPRLSADTRFHLRWETFNLEAEAQIAEWIAHGWIHLLAFNDHTPEMLRRAERPKDLVRYVERTGLEPDAFRALVARMWEQRDEVPGAIERLARLGRDRGIPLASHDDDSPEMRQQFRELGCRLSEFPKTVETAREARAAGDAVIMGAPNVVRGGSHLNLTSAASLVCEDLCTVLSSDYYYPALLHAAFRLVEDNVLPLERAWPLVSANPAAAGGLQDRGTIEAGKRADIILVDDRAGTHPRVVATFVAGRPVYLQNDALPRAA
jgi:alpha-D-ribose 1-methylphosphonate 5-triphosphate diphosphatase